MGDRSKHSGVPAIAAFIAPACMFAFGDSAAEYIPADQNQHWTMTTGAGESVANERDLPQSVDLQAPVRSAATRVN